MKDFQISRLCDIYGSLLSLKQRKIVELTYNFDMSLFEISEKIGITRQGVRSQLVKAEKALLAFEAHLGLVKMRDEIRGISEIDSANVLKKRLTEFKEKYNI